MQAGAIARPGTGTLTDVLWPRIGVWQRDAVRDLVLVVGFSFLMALVAQIKISFPGTPVPITGQTFGVLLTGAALGSRRGAASMFLYILWGGTGIPVFAGWGSGLIWSFGSGGYIIGFVLGAYVVGWFAERGWDRRPWIIVAMLLGNAAIYIPGLLQLGFFVPWSKVLPWGLYPFIPGDLIKLYLASMALPTAWAITGGLRGSAKEAAALSWRWSWDGIAAASAGFLHLVAWTLLVASKMELGVYDVTNLSVWYWAWLAASVLVFGLGLRQLGRSVGQAAKP